MLLNVPSTLPTTLNVGSISFFRSHLSSSISALSKTQRRDCLTSRSLAFATLRKSAFIFSLGFDKRDDSWPPSRSNAKKAGRNFVICHPVSSSSGSRPSLHFGRRRFFGVLFLCVFPQRRLVNVANFRRGGEAPPFPLRFDLTLLSPTFESQPTSRG